MGLRKGMLFSSCLDEGFVGEVLACCQAVHLVVHDHVKEGSPLRRIDWDKVIAANAESVTVAACHPVTVGVPVNLASFRP